RTAHRDVSVARVLLESLDAVDQVALESLRVAPSELATLVGHDDLSRVAQVLGEFGIFAFTLRLHFRPRSREAVVRHPSEEKRVGGGHDAIDGSAHLVVEVLEVPVLHSIDDTVERDEERGPNLSHTRPPR